ncbi:unnamed protein product, partial [Heterotrigona itama]
MDGEARPERLEEENKSGGDDLDSFRLLFLRGTWAVMVVGGGCGGRISRLPNRRKLRDFASPTRRGEYFITSDIEQVHA